MTNFNAGALLAHFIKGAIDGFLAFIGISAVTKITFTWATAAGSAAFVGGLRAIQESWIPTSYVREPGAAAAPLSGGKK